MESLINDVKAITESNISEKEKCDTLFLRVVELFNVKVWTTPLTKQELAKKLAHRGIWNIDGYARLTNTANKLFIEIENHIMAINVFIENNATDRIKRMQEDLVNKIMKNIGGC